MINNNSDYIVLKSYSIKREKDLKPKEVYSYNSELREIAFRKSNILSVRGCTDVSIKTRLGIIPANDVYINKLSIISTSNGLFLILMEPSMLLNKL